MEKSTKKRVRNVVLGMTSVALVAGITASLTLAYLTSTATKENVFSGTPGITALLLEPLYDGDLDGGTVNTDSDGKIIPDTGTDGLLPEGEDWGYNDAQDYMPGDVINKNPYVVNTSSDKQVYVQLHVQYLINGYEVSYDDFAKFAEPVYNTTNFNSKWEEKSGSDKTVFYYTDGTNLALVDVSSQTEELFADVKIKSDLTIKDGKVHNAAGVIKVTVGEEQKDCDTLPKLEIKLAAAIVAADETDPDTQDYRVALDSVTVNFS